MRRLSIAMVVLLVAVSVVAGCGKDEASLLDRALKQDIHSGTLSMRVEVSDPNRSSPAFALTLRGPFKENGRGRLASFDWKLRGEGMSAGALDARIVSSGRNVFIQYKGQTYQVGERKLAELQRESRKGGQQKIENLKDAQRLGLHLQDWFPSSEVEHDSRVGDEPTTRVTGRLDVSAALRTCASSRRTPGSEPTRR